jgi:hypothetical protein
MKLTFSYFPSFWVKVCPIILMFLSIGLTSMQAQNYKPLDEAMASVTAAIDNLSSEKFVKASVSSGGSGQASTTTAPAQTPLLQKKVFEISYFAAFLREAKLANDVAVAVQALDAMFQGQPQPRAATVTAARADLMELITY